MTKLLKNYPLANYSNIKTGGQAELAIFPETHQELINIFCDNPSTPVIAGGTNCIISDAGIKKIILLKEIKTTPTIIDKNIIEVCASQKTGPLLQFMKNNNLKGLGFMAGIPGNTIGGAIYQNFGAYGKLISNYIKSVKYISNNKIIETDIKDILFDYRTSTFKENNFKIISAKLHLEKGTQAELYREITETTQKRRKHNPLKLPNIGCIFKNPTNNYAGKIIEECNLKGYNINDIEIWNGHANFIVNKGTGQTKYILEMIDYIKKVVFDKTGITLEEEINYIGNSK